MARFADFFESPRGDAAQPEALGFDGFFKGAFVYHWHNQWYVSGLHLTMHDSMYL